MPPTAIPISTHITRFQPKLGIAPQIDVPMKPTPAYRIEARRPILTPSQPQRKDPNTVLTMPDSATQPTGTVPVGLRGDLRQYSSVIPGITKARAVGFLTSIVKATAMVNNKPTCAQLSDASSSALTWMREAIRGPSEVIGGESP